MKTQKEYAVHHYTMLVFNSKKFSTFHGVSNFLRKQSSLVLESTLLRTLFMLGSKKTFECENRSLEKLHSRHAKIKVLIMYLIQNDSFHVFYIFRP